MLCAAKTDPVDNPGPLEDVLDRTGDGVKIVCGFDRVIPYEVRGEHYFGLTILASDKFCVVRGY